MTVVGEASLLIRADTSMLAADVAGQSEAALAGVGASASVVGTEAGTNLRKGIEGETALLAAGVGADAEKAGQSIEEGLGRGTKASDDLAKKVEGDTSKMKQGFQDLGSKASNALQGIGVPKFLTEGPAVVTLLGAAAGTTKTGKDAEATLRLYGLSAKTANGELTPLSTIIGGLEPKFKTMTQAQQLATATAIFGAAAAKQMTAVILAGSSAFDQATAAVLKHNAVQDAAAVKEKTLAGEIDILKAGITSEATQLGGVLVPALTAVVGAIAPVIGGFTDLVKWFEQGSAPAIAIATVIGAVLAPAIINMGVQATVSAAKAVIAFVQTGAAATVNAAKTVGALATQDVAVQTAATTVVTSAGEVEAAA